METRLFSVVLPWPPSQNKSLIPMRGKGRFIKSKESRDWFSIAEGRCAAAHGIGLVFPIEPVCVHITLMPGRRQKGDLDNGIKKTLDAMSMEAYLDDRQVRRLYVKFLDLPPGGESCITVLVWRHRGDYDAETLDLIDSLIG